MSCPQVTWPLTCFYVHIINSALKMTPPVRHSDITSDSFFSTCPSVWIVSSVKINMNESLSLMFPLTCDLLSSFFNIYPSRGTIFFLPNCTVSAWRRQHWAEATKESVIVLFYCSELMEEEHWCFNLSSQDECAKCFIGRPDLLVHTKMKSYN